MVGRLLRLRRLRVFVAMALAFVHLCSAGPAAASLIYCLGENGHHGIELVRHGQRGCAACCHESGATPHAQPPSPADKPAPAAPDGEGSECTDVSLGDESAFPGRHTVPSWEGTVAVLPVWSAPALVALRVPGLSPFPARVAPNLSSRRAVVLLI